MTVTPWQWLIWNRTYYFLVTPVPFIENRLEVLLCLPDGLVATSVGRRYCRPDSPDFRVTTASIRVAPMRLSFLSKVSPHHLSAPPTVPEHAPVEGQYCSIDRWPLPESPFRQGLLFHLSVRIFQIQFPGIYFFHFAFLHDISAPVSGWLSCKARKNA